MNIPSLRWLGRLIVLSAVAVGLCSAARSVRSQPAPVPAIRSAADLWRGYDPEALPLEISEVRVWEEGGVRYRKLFFTGEIAEGKPTRVLAIEGAPLTGTKLPGVVHIHGGGQTLSQEWVRFWASRGYVAVSFDFCGRLPGRAEFTDWGPIPHGNMIQAAGGFQVHPTPRESSWYHWAVASRRALTLLEHHPQVDPHRMGIFGISVGGTLCWLVAAFDARVRTAIPIYGCGYNHDNRNVRWGFGELSPDLAIYKQTLSPEAHAPYIRCPLLYLSATNDFHGPMDYAFDALGAVRGPVRQAFTPRTNHHLEPEQGGDVERWMEWQLKGGKGWPSTPGLKLEVDSEGVPRAQVIPDRARDVRHVEIYYSLGDRFPQARFWRTAGSTERRPWNAALPVMDPWEPVYGFANVTYASGVCLSTRLEHAVPGQLGSARATLAPRTDWTHGSNDFENWFYTAGYTDPNARFRYLRVEDDPGGRFLALTPEVSGEPTDFMISTHLPGDPQFQGPDGAALSFEYRGDFRAKGLTVNAYTNDWRPTSRTFTVVVPGPAESDGWHTARLEPRAFRAADGAVLSRWKDVERIEIRGTTPRRSPPGFRHFRWVIP